MNVCMYCGKDENERNVDFRAIYQPFDTSPTTEGYICDYCDDDIYYCECCDREIYDSNGMRKNIRWDEIDGTVCVSCLQKKWFKEGMEKFKDGDWFLDKELLEHGFIKYDSYFCKYKENYDDAETEFDLLQDKGLLVILSIESSGMGLEHHIAIWTKEIPVLTPKEIYEKSDMKPDTPIYYKEVGKE